ncbi:signal peptidase II [Wolbachia endosymbiont of Atemnus politus]|uniref:signal peptidase II n=1 Tax=Wolbachia endosymbiont of Atemnus politus TaxID=2682840 RepID=UPI0015741690|nr:signal peptidase II [Wolbachia endosymbiont of Atemnus politus]NSM56433.1 signal peptidase II [Wolbachia endosymbiont of Atemnus politus]NSX83207.1 signal peptidase II [Wolbachia endosymbiont of Atemnus politus]
MKKLCLIIILIIVLTDQMSKLYINSLIDEGESINVSNFMKLVEVWNSGISFGMFSTLPYSDLFFSAFSTLIIGVLAYLVYKSNDKLTCLGFSLMIGGAIGNVVDRIYWGAVYDFICFHIGNWYWPAFNLADIYIACGMFTLLYKWYIYDRFISKHNEK